MPELPVVGDAPSKAASGAGGFVTKRVGPLPLWAWAAAAGLAVLALRLFARSKGAPTITGAGVATTTAGIPSSVSPGAASGSGSFVGQALPPILVSIIQPSVSATGTPAAAITATTATPQASSPPFVPLASYGANVPTTADTAVVNGTKIWAGGPFSGQPVATTPANAGDLRPYLENPTMAPPPLSLPLTVPSSGLGATPLAAPVTPWEPPATPPTVIKSPTGALFISPAYVPTSAAAPYVPPEASSYGAPSDLAQRQMAAAIAGQPLPNY